jgi:hypothetical protein
MKGEKVRPLAKRWQDGVRLLHASAQAENLTDAYQFIAQEVEWTAGALEDAEPWPALHARLEPLGELKLEEQRILIGMRAQDAEHAMSLICLAVRLHRIAAWLDSMATVPVGKKTGPTPKNMSKHITLARALYNGGNAALSQRAAADQAIKKLGKGKCATTTAAIDYVRHRILDMPVGIG